MKIEKGILARFEHVFFRGEWVDEKMGDILSFIDSHGNIRVPLFLHLLECYRASAKGSPYRESWIGIDFWGKFVHETEGRYDAFIKAITKSGEPLGPKKIAEMVSVCMHPMNWSNSFKRCAMLARILGETRAGGMLGLFTTADTASAEYHSQRSLA